jgi:predicted nuclease of predicted toxin-antitoxin system
MLLFDENLSPRLVMLLGDRFPGCIHVDTLGLRGAPDAAVWDYARDNALTIVSKDADFVTLTLMRTAPTKVICLWVGNVSTDAIAGLLEREGDAIDRFLRSSGDSLLVLSDRDRRRQRPPRVREEYAAAR